MPQTREEQYDILSNAISKVLTPVMICMALAIWFVHSLGDVNQCRRATHGRNFSAANSNASGDGTTSDSSYSNTWAIVFIAIFVLLMVVFTFLILWLYKSGRQKIIKGWLVVAVFLIFAYVGGLYVFDFCRSRCIPIDWITLVFAIWNFSVTGVYSVFGRAPRIVNQAYLIVMSALMAYIFRGLPGFAVWVILGILVVWDLFAVLSPYGPLRLLVEAAREKQEDLPALVYDTNPADNGRQANNSARARGTREPRATSATASRIKPDPPASASQQSASAATPVADRPDEQPSQQPSMTRPKPKPESDSRSDEQLSHPTPSPSPAAEGPGSILPEIDPAPHIPAETNASAVPPVDGTKHHGLRALLRRRMREETPTGEDANASTSATPGRETEGEYQVGTMGTHLKLGLGDFVFYSLLVAQASRSGAMAAVASFIAILAGLCATLFLVTVYRIPLPALPISITVGLVTFFLTRYTMQPFVHNLLPELLFY